MQPRKRRTLKKIKDSELKIRISSDKKEEIKIYCDMKKMSMTEFITMAIDDFIKKEDK